jgi:hypothetical protein
MRVQCLCQLCIVLMACSSAYAAETEEAGKTPLHNYPTVARMEYVNNCMAKTTDKLAAMYQCSCAIDRIADALSYDQFIEALTYARNAALPGEGGGIFRDSDRARQMAKRFRELESASLTGCGMIL